MLEPEARSRMAHAAGRELCRGRSAAGAMREPTTVPRIGGARKAARLGGRGGGGHLVQFARLIQSGFRGRRQPGRDRQRRVPLRRAPDAQGHQHALPAREGGRDHGAVRLRQDHPAAPDRRAAQAQPRAGARSPASWSTSSIRTACTRCAGAWACCSSSARCSPTCRCSTTWRSRCASTPICPKRMIRDLVLMKLHAVGLRGAQRPDALGAVRRHGAARGAGARDRARPDADHVRRAVRRAGSDFAERDRQSDPPPERCAGRDFDRGDARRAGVAEDRRLRLFHVRRRDRRGGHARRDPRLRQSLRAPVRAWRDGRPGAVPLSGRALSRAIWSWRLRDAGSRTAVVSALRQHRPRVIDGVWRLGYASRFFC